MAKRRPISGRHKWADDPGRLTFLDNPYDLWGKLSWEVSQFLGLLMGPPPRDPDGMVYTLQNACITTVALIDWIQRALVQRCRSQRKPFDQVGFNEQVSAEMANFALAKAIAGTVKHGEYRDEGWTDAEVRLTPLFTTEQRGILDNAAEDMFDALYAELATEAEYSIRFGRADGASVLDAREFAEELSSGCLRLLDGLYSQP